MLSFAPTRAVRHSMIVLMILVFSSTACNGRQEAPATGADSDTSAVVTQHATKTPTKLNCGNKANPHKSPVIPGDQFQVEVIGGSSAVVDMRTNTLVEDKRRVTVARGDVETFHIVDNAQGEDTLDFVVYGCDDDTSAADSALVTGPPTMFVE